MEDTTIVITETKNEGKVDTPNANYIAHMTEKINQCRDIPVRVQMIIDLFTYLTKFTEFILNHTEVSYALRDRVKRAEQIANESFESGEIDFETAMSLVSVANQLLKMTEHLADFDCGLIPCEDFSQNNNDNSDEDRSEDEKDFFGFEQDEGECEGEYKQEEKDFFGFEGDYKQEEEYEGYYDY